MNHDGAVNVLDIMAVAGRWNQTAGPPHDLDQDGVITVSDIMRVAGRWKERCS